MKLSFHGAAGMVTGSNYLIETEQARVLVDCGLFQGRHEDEHMNFEPFPYDPASIDAVILTHAHLDHTGRLPMLHKEGFENPIFGTRATLDLARIVLEDSIGIMRERHEREGALMYYDFDALDICWNCTRAQKYDSRFSAAPGVEVVFKDAGHILGSAIVEVYVTERGKETKLVFSGDLGNSPAPFLKPTDSIEGADYVIIESTYGNRLHEDNKRRKEKLKAAVEASIVRGGTLMIPAFAIERTQEILYELNSMTGQGDFSNVPIFLDSPMAIKATQVYKNNNEHFNREAVQRLEGDDDLFSFPTLTMTKSVDESKKINTVPPPKIIIAGSGMSTGGRILHHERRYLQDSRSTLLIIGFQVSGTLGRRILDGAREVTIWKEPVSVRCHVQAIGGYSAHADQAGLMKWLGGFVQKPKRVFVTHGEPDAAEALAQKARSGLDLTMTIPTLHQSFLLS